MVIINWLLYIVANMRALLKIIWKIIKNLLQGEVFWNHVRKINCWLWWKYTAVVNGWNFFTKHTINLVWKTKCNDLRGENISCCIRLKFRYEIKTITQPTSQYIKAYHIVHTTSTKTTERSAGRTSNWLIRLEWKPRIDCVHKWIYTKQFWHDDSN